MSEPRWRTVGLRVRVAALFATGALLLSSLMTVAAFQVSRAYLIRQRDSLAVREAIVNAQVVTNVLGSPSADPRTIVDGLAGSNNSRPLLRVGKDWYAASVSLGQGEVPADLAADVQVGQAARQRTVVNDVPYIVTGVPLPNVGDYYEFAPLVELPRTLQVFGRTLTAAAGIVTVLGAVLGWWASRRVLRPLHEASAAARSISGGDLSARVPVGRDPDLAPMAVAFNDMAQAVEDRVNREVRFSADVSHELRTPLTAILSAVQLAKRCELPPRAEMAIEMLSEQTAYFRDLVLDLLAISRFDGGPVEVDLEPVDLGALVQRLTIRTGLDPQLVHLDVDEACTYELDRRRVELMLTNLLDNADKYGGGATRLDVRDDGDMLRFAVEDEGPGVSPEERKVIFGRFTRGRAASTAKGTGLGLALVDEHARAHGGTVEVVDAAHGGARFVISLPNGRVQDRFGLHGSADAP